jgi:hypothetical protein
MIPQFRPEDSGYGVLKCPNCGGEYLHHQLVDVYSRREDAEHGVHAVVWSGDSPDGSRQEWPKLESDSDVSNNPSSRRGGFGVRFYCEECDVLSALIVSQHNGQTFVKMKAIT